MDMITVVYVNIFMLFAGSATGFGKDQRNWCPHTITRVSPCRVTALTPFYHRCPYGGVSWCTSYRLTYRVKYRAQAQTEWRCCPGFRGNQCEEPCFTCSNVDDMANRISKLELTVLNGSDTANSQSCACPPGPRGPSGPEGKPGAKGEPGVKGEMGMKGEPGVPISSFQPAVPRPSPFPDLKRYPNSDGVPIPPRSPGPPGATGPQGRQGLKGDRGEPGLHGPNGETGKPGPRGVKGDLGVKGERGVPGPAGENVNLLKKEEIMELRRSVQRISEEFTRFRTELADEMNLLKQRMMLVETILLQIPEFRDSFKQNSVPLKVIPAPTFIQQTTSSALSQYQEEGSSLPEGLINL